MFPAGINTRGTNTGFPLGINPTTLLRVLIECITVTFLAQSIATLTFTETIATLAFSPEATSSLLFNPMPSAALTWLATDSALSFLNSIEPELTFHAVTSCPTP